MTLKWKKTRARKFRVATSTSGRYQILHHVNGYWRRGQQDHLLFFIPAGTQSELGVFRTAEAAKRAAEKHSLSRAAHVERCTASMHVMGPCGRPRPCPKHDEVKCDGWPGRRCFKKGIVLEVTDRLHNHPRLAWVWRPGQWNKRRHRRLCASCAKTQAPGHL